jgi:hypothetical protein
LSFTLITDPRELRDSGWDAFVASHPESTVFQSPDMFDLFARADKMQPVVVGITEGNSRTLKGILLGVIIREMEGLSGYFSSRTVIYGGPLVDAGPQGCREQERPGDEEKIMCMLLDGLISQVKKRSVFIQFRNFSSQEPNKDIFSSAGFHFRNRLNLLVDTSGMETVRKNISPARLRQVRKGFAMGARCIDPENIGQVRQFYEILSDLYKDKVRKPLPDWSFFENFYRISQEGRLGIIRLVEYKGKIIGGILSPVTPGRTIYEWYVCGLDQQYREVYPSVLATWSAIEYAVEKQIPCFDFMGVGLPEREYGVREFKKRFGGEMVNYGRFARINNKALYFAAETGYNLLAMIKKI